MTHLPRPQVLVGCGGYVDTLLGIIQGRCVVGVSETGASAASKRGGTGTLGGARIRQPLQTGSGTACPWTAVPLLNMHAGSQNSSMTNTGLHLVLLFLSRLCTIRA